MRIKHWRAFGALLGAALVPWPAGCDRDGLEEPDFERLFPPLLGRFMTTSSPELADLDGDGVPDIVFGTGVDRVRPEASGYVVSDEPAVSGYVVAVSGATNEVLWEVPANRDAYTTPRFLRVDGDDTPDVVMGGREGSFAAFSGVDGAELWRLDPAEVAETDRPYGFFTPFPLGDVDGDGVEDLVVTYGGNDTKLPGEPRETGYVVVVSGAEGRLLAVHPVPDGSETYASPVVYERPGGAPWVIFGTGGETHGGAAWRAPVASLLDGSFPDRVERLGEAGEKGVMAPPTLLDVNGDGELDPVISAFDGRLFAVDGATGDVLWEDRRPGEESYHQPAVVRMEGGRLGLFLSRGVGVFPNYTGTAHRLYDAAAGRVLYEHTDGWDPGGQPLAVDLNGDGVDEPIFFSVLFPARQGARIHLLDLGTQRIIHHDVDSNLWTTPRVADPRGTGSLEMIAVSWILEAGTGADWERLRWLLLRIDLDAPAVSPTWGGYMGTGADGRLR